MAPRRQKQHLGANQHHANVAPPQQLQIQQQQQQHQQYSGAGNFEMDPNLRAQLVRPPVRSEAELNVSVLQRYNAEITGLEHIASYGVIYEWSTETNSWDKSGIEGSVFVCKLWGNADSDERFAIVVLNRRQLNNFDYELKSKDDVEVTDEYIILMDPGAAGGQKVYGLWIFADPPPSSTASQRQEMADKVMECINRVEESQQDKTAQLTAVAAAAAEAATVTTITPALAHSSQPVHVEPSYTHSTGRQLNVQDLFASNSQQPSWTEAHHLAQPVADTSHPHSALATPSMFSHSAETSFFMNQSQRATPANPQQQAVVPAPMEGETTSAQREHLLNLFRQAGGSD